MLVNPSRRRVIRFLTENHVPIQSQCSYDSVFLHLILQLAWMTINTYLFVNAFIDLDTSKKKLLPSSYCQGKCFLYSQSNRDAVFTYAKIQIRIRSGNPMVCFWNNKIWMSFLRLPPLILTFQSSTYLSFVLFPKFCYSNGRIDNYQYTLQRAPIEMQWFSLYFILTGWFGLGSCVCRCAKFQLHADSFDHVQKSSLIYQRPGGE